MAATGLLPSSRWQYGGIPSSIFVPLRSDDSSHEASTSMLPSLFFKKTLSCKDRYMTTRQSLNQRFYRGWLWLIAFSFLLGVLQLGAFGTDIGGPAIREAGLLAIALIVYYRWLTPCLNCHRPLKWFALAWRPPSDPLTSPHCPYCDVSIDHDTIDQQ